jgi:hypothetical protein
MTAIQPKFVEAGGIELVILTRAEYDALVTAAAGAEEDAADVAIDDRRKVELENEPSGLLPAEVPSARQHTSIYIPVSAYDRIREIAFKRRLKVNDVMLEALNGYLERHP